MDRESNLVVISAFLALNVRMACIFDLYKKLKGSLCPHWTCVPVDCIHVCDYLSVLNNIMQCRVSSSIILALYTGFPSSTTPHLRSPAMVVCCGNVTCRGRLESTVVVWSMMEKYMSVVYFKSMRFPLTQSDCRNYKCQPHNFKTIWFHNILAVQFWFDRNPPV